MKIRITTLLTVLLACFALSATTACGKKDDDKEKGSSAKNGADDKEAMPTKTDDNATDKKPADTAAASGDKSKLMHALADKIIAKSKEICACKDKACVAAKDKEMETIMAEGEKTFGKEAMEAEPPKEISDKIMPAMTAAAECMNKITNVE